MDLDRAIVVPKVADATAVAPGRLAHLSDLYDYMLADPVPDFRGWPVMLPNGRRVGTVDDLLVDTDQMTVRYLEVKVESRVILADEDTWVLVPASAARLDTEMQAVVIERMPQSGVAAAPRYNRGAITSELGRAIDEYYDCVPH